MADRLKVPGLPLFIIATAFGVSSTVQAYLLRTLEGGGPGYSLLALLALNLVYWYVPALLAPTIMAVAVRYQLGRVRGSTQVALHICGAIVYSLAHITILLATRSALAWAGALPYPMAVPTLQSFWVYARVTYLSQLDWLLMTY